jgi:hypothetical protein
MIVLTADVLSGAFISVQENLARHTRWIVAGSVAIALLWRRDSISLTLMVGTVLNLNTTLPVLSLSLADWRHRQRPAEQDPQAGIEGGPPRRRTCL